MTNEEARQIFIDVIGLWPKVAYAFDGKLQPSSGYSTFYDENEQIHDELANQYNDHDRFLMAAIINWCLFQFVGDLAKTRNKIEMKYITIKDIKPNLVAHMEVKENTKIVKEYLKALKLI